MDNGFKRVNLLMVKSMSVSGYFKFKTTDLILLYSVTIVCKSDCLYLISTWLREK